jgi:hypothetical protein
MPDQVTGNPQTLRLAQLQQRPFAPETAIGTGAANPVVDEVEAAKLVPSVDESTAGKGQNQPGQGDGGIDYSGDPTAEPTSDVVSTGREFEVLASEDNDTAGGDSVASDSSDVNKPAEDVRPEVPQATKRSKGREKA